MILQGYTDLRIDYTYKGTYRFASYKNFMVQDEANLYRMSYTSYTGNNSLDDLYNSKDVPFSTFDRETYGCSNSYSRTGWWWNQCGSSNLNGIWGDKRYAMGIFWSYNTGVFDSLDFVEMKLRKPNT